MKCGKCSATCPAYDEMEYHPHQFVSMVPGEVIVGCILRKDQTIIPRGDSRILAGDTLVLLSSAHQETAAIHELTGR